MSPQKTLNRILHAVKHDGSSTADEVMRIIGGENNATMMLRELDDQLKRCGVDV